MIGMVTQPTHGRVVLAGDWHGDTGWAMECVRRAAEGRALVTEAFHGVSPMVQAHGHYRVADSKAVRVPDGHGESLVVSLSDQRSLGNMAILDLNTMRASNFAQHGAEPLREPSDTA